MQKLLSLLLHVISTLSLSLILGLMVMVILPTSADTLSESQIWPMLPAEFDTIAALDSSPPSFGPTPLIAPADAVTVTNPRPTFDWDDATDDVGVVSYTLRITGENPFTGLSTQATTVDITTTNSIYTPTQVLPNGAYAWTVQAHDAAGNVSGFVAPYTFTMQAILWQAYLPIIQVNPQPICPTASSANFEVIPIESGILDHLPPLHADLNLALRDYSITNAAKSLQNINGPDDINAPQLAGLFEPNQFPGISNVYRVNDWDWNCGADGCRGGPITNPEVTLIGLSATVGQSIYIPERGPEIFGGGYKAMVLYAEERRITLVYTRQDDPANGYLIHLENICIDPNLFSLYQAQTDVDGKHVTGHLPALRNNQALGTALTDEIQVVIRDTGAFMDPRSQKDWWDGF